MGKTLGDAANLLKCRVLTPNSIGILTRVVLIVDVLVLSGLLVWLAWPQQTPEKTLGEAINLFTCCIFTWNAFTIVLPAFLVAGALVVFVPSYSVMKYFGAKANRVVAYGAASMSGNVLTVCSCNVVPIFAGILRRGAGIGPAFCFVFAAPAIHIINTIFTYQVIGIRLALWRLFTVPVIAILVGLAMALFFRREEAARQRALEAAREVALVQHSSEQSRRAGIFLGMLVAALIFGAWLSLDPYFPKAIGQFVRLAGVVTALVGLVWLALLWFGREETVEWGRQTWLLLRMIVPIFVVAVLAIAFIVNRIPMEWYSSKAHESGTGGFFGHPHGNGIFPVFVSTVFSTLMYFPMLTEVAFAKGLLLRYFALGPALAILLGGPGLSLPGLLLVSRVAGWKKMIVYYVVMVTLITVVSFAFGSYYGEYECSCQRRAVVTAPQESGIMSAIGLAWYGAIFLWIGLTIAHAWRNRAPASSAEELA